MEEAWKIKPIAGEALLRASLRIRRSSVRPTVALENRRQRGKGEEAEARREKTGNRVKSTPR